MRKTKRRNGKGLQAEKKTASQAKIRMKRYTGLMVKSFQKGGFCNPAGGGEEDALCR